MFAVLSVAKRRNLGMLRSGLVAGVLLLSAGCVTPRPPADKKNAVDDKELAAEAAVAPPAEPTEVVTDLSKLSSADAVSLPALPEVKPAIAPSTKLSNNPINPELTGKLAADAPSLRYNPDAPPQPGGTAETHLLNDKARQFSTFSELLIKQTLQAARELAPQQLQQHRVPTDLNPVILLSMLDNEGRLQEIEIDQRSGDAAVDKLFIEACKKGMWSRNPPIGAVDNDGKYRIRIEGQVYNYAFDRYGQYTYDTQLRLSLL